MSSLRLTLCAALISLPWLAGCGNQQQKAAEQHDAETRRQVERLKQKSNAYPINGSNSKRYIP